MGKAIALAAVGMALASLAHAAQPAMLAKEDRASSSEAPGSQTTMQANDALDRFFAFVSTLRSTSELTKENVEQGMGVALGKSEGGMAYRSPVFGKGWTYVVRQLVPTGRLKAGFSFGFFNPDPSADPGPVCVATLERVRASLVSRGFTEAITPGEIGQIVAWNFVKNDLMFTVTPADLATRRDGTECVRVIHTTDG
jgi:hypothetical protein